jgi:hypothetical protein
MLVSVGVEGGMNAPSKRVKITRTDFVMAGLVPAIHVLLSALKMWMPGTIGERSDAVLRTAMAGHDGVGVRATRMSKAKSGRKISSDRRS